MHLTRDGRRWRIGTPDEVAWITASTPTGRTIGSAIPAGFAAYATLVDPDHDGRGNLGGSFAAAVLEHLAALTPAPWWLGYLDTGVDDVVFADAPRVSMYARWNYVLALAGPDQAASWRSDHRGPAMPDLMFPVNRSWLVSTLWDDSWTCLGGPVELVAALQASPRVLVRFVSIDEDMTPPGHTMY